MIMYMHATLTFICTCMHKCFLFVICFILLHVPTYLHNKFIILSYLFVYIISLCLSLLIYHFYVNIQLFKIKKMEERVNNKQRSKN